VFFRVGNQWSGWSTSPLIQSQLSLVLPKENRLAAQVVRQALPIVIDDTLTRIEDVGELIADAGVRSFALLPIMTSGKVGGLAYLNFCGVEKANLIFEPEIGRSIELILNCAGTSAGTIRRGES